MAVNNGSNRFLMEKNKCLEAMIPSNQGSQTKPSVMTLDEAIQQRFLSKTVQLAHTKQQTEPFFVKLVTPIQTMSVLLRRQTFPLQNKIGNPSKLSDKHMQHVKRPIPRGTNKELYQDLETRSENCNETLNKAFSWFGDTNDNHVLEDYRKMFTLGKAFLEEMHYKVLPIVANQTFLVSIMVGENKVEVKAKRTK